MALDTRSEKVKKIKRIVKIVFILIVAILIFWAKTYPHRSTLIMTAAFRNSSFEKIEYLEFEKVSLGKSKIEFAIYDEESELYQVCITKDIIYHDRGNLRVYVDGKETSFSVMRNGTIWKDNTIIFLEEVPQYQEFTIRYLDDTAAVYWNK